MTNDFKGLWDRAIHKSIDFRGRPATVGKIDGTVYVTAENGTVYKSRMWVTYTDTGAKLNEAIVRCVRVPFVPGMPVIIKNIKGIPTAVIDDGPQMDVYSDNGNSVPGEAHNHYLEGPNPEYVEGRRFMPVGVHPSEPPALTVYVEPGAYRYLSAAPDFWEGGTSGSLSVYVPVVNDGRIHFVIIALDRSDNSIDIIDGADALPGGDIYFPTLAVVTYADILAIPIDAKYMPLAVVELTYGQTTIGVKHITHDYRLWGGEVPSPLDIDALMEDTAPDVTADFLVTLDTSAGVIKKVLAENMPGIKGNVGMVFSQTADGTVANTTTPTDILSTGVGSVTIPADTLLPGVVVRVFMAGHLSTTGTPDFELSVELGGDELASTGVNTLASSLSNVGWRLWLDLVCRGFPVTGSIVASGVWRLGASMYGLVNASTTAVDPTDPLQIEVLAAWGTADAANTVTCQVATVEILSIVGL